MIAKSKLQQESEVLLSHCPNVTDIIIGVVGSLEMCSGKIFQREMKGLPVLKSDENVNFGQCS